MNTFPTSVKKERALFERMQRLGVYEKDLEERFVRSGGPGGQNVNKVSTCVTLKHGPSGIQVKCARERSQGLNRFLARRILLDKLEAKRLGRVSAERQRIEKIRRQKRRRSRRAKEKMLAGKKIRGRKKSLRGPVHSEE